MISLCLIYSNERLPQAKQVASYIKSLNIRLELLQICDGNPNCKLDGYRQIIVPRKHKEYFIRSDIWNAAIKASTNEIIAIIDCDRLISSQFFEIAETLANSDILYTKNLIQLNNTYSFNELLQCLKQPPPTSTPDHRVKFTEGTIRPAKNPMSGCVAFTKTYYTAIGGMSTEFVGWGFNDTDFYANAYFKGANFIELDCVELHIHHGYEISKTKLLAMNAWNAVRFYDKYNIPIHYDLYDLFKFLKTDIDFIRNADLKTFMNEIR